MPANCTLVDGESPACFCPLGDVIETLGRKYALRLVCVIGADGPIRFSELEAYLPAASSRTLSDSLDDLAAQGLVARDQYDEIPPRVEYHLTDEGEDLCTRLEPLLAWATDR